ncbi:GNAT family N-acetyltransferase [Mucilaginibacter rubeus]|uniref:GNAT family N-acetyltransferase n=1 Tax=Mucilaginibacter rubeus TaxID=2027860 RepID=A0AAE6JFA1_9SPHI|nr:MULTISPECIES: GNAT family N-acetyltransferase [Mucilaginibacter]QEM04543.1 GNAT family N-acetyltransferase [Mucilaginibacter rubeus]QEM17137.1 GNAT family N-acetyltransferase [Mucilaginibacter gossypii]QTE46357.1 GNAT family N-acetyltransferase [Mucilaginibacter rubeus]QTE52954.1 GNAT family N-acetyltransferase [Mucilaginibacter rubeus]QTE58040.1 GNAT family N-acetyltransferase [Mucilaginibacter rubeus]
MLIRKATIEDLPVLLQFEQGIITAERPFDSTLKPDPISYYDLKAFITSTDVQVLVAEIDGEIAGSGYARIKKNPDAYYDFEKYAYLGFMYVLPAYRGMGVNQAIIEELKKWIVEQGVTEIRLEVYNDNIGAIKAYEKAGFKKRMIEMRIRL